MRTLIALCVAVVLASIPASGQSAERATPRTLVSASLTKVVGFVDCQGAATATVTVTHTHRPVVLARVQAVLPRTLPPSRSVTAIPDTGTYSLRLVLRNGTRRWYENNVPAGLKRAYALFSPLVHLCGR